MLSKYGTQSIIKHFSTCNPFTNVYGFARSLFALGTLLTLLFNEVGILFRPALGIPDVPICQGVAGRISLFCLLSSNLFLAKCLAASILVVVISGWRPRFTGVLHWWISFSFMNSAILVDGGDQVTGVLTLLLIPVTLLDNRKWHWSNSFVDDSITHKEACRRIIANSTYKIIRLQVAVIYLHAAVAKTYVPEWQNGTALFYWFTDPMFGLSETRKSVVMSLLTNHISVSLLTWSIVVLEFLLFAGLIADKKYWAILFRLGLIFHIGIAVVHGLISFFIAMTAALILFLKPWSQGIHLNFSFSFLKKSIMRREQPLKDEKSAGELINV